MILIFMVDVTDKQFCYKKHNDETLHKCSWTKLMAAISKVQMRPKYENTIYKIENLKLKEWEKIKQFKNLKIKHIREAIL